MGFSCRAYGLGIELNVPLAGLRGLPPASRIDIRATLGTLPQDALSVPDDQVDEFYRGLFVDEQGDPFIRVARLFGGRYLRIRYRDGTVFVVTRELNEVWAAWPEPLTIEDTATYFLGPILGILLRLRGVTCLHASAISIGNEAIAFVGPSGSGKSSTAAAFARRGHGVLADDLVAIHEQAGAFYVQPAYPRLRLWSESVQSLFGDAEFLPALTPNWDKRYLNLLAPGYSFAQEPLRLAAIYVLGERREIDVSPEVRDIAAADALMDMISDTFATGLIDSATRAAEFQLLGRVVGSVPQRVVVTGDNQSRIAELCEVVERDFERIKLLQPT